MWRIGIVWHIWNFRVCGDEDIWWKTDKRPSKFGRLRNLNERERGGERGGGEGCCISLKFTHLVIFTTAHERNRLSNNFALKYFAFPPQWTILVYEEKIPGIFIPIKASYELYENFSLFFFFLLLLFYLLEWGTFPCDIFTGDSIARPVFRHTSNLVLWRFTDVFS